MPSKFYHFNAANKIVIGYESENLEAARKEAQAWNKKHRKDADRTVAFIGNYSKPTECTRFTVIN